MAKHCIEAVFNGIECEMDIDGSVVIRNPEHEYDINLWEDDLIALYRFFQYPDVAKRFAWVLRTHGDMQADHTA